MEPVIEYIQEVGALPLIKSFCDKLRLAELIDEILPLAPQALMGNGIVFVALLMNRLTTPRPLYRLVEWGQKWGLFCVLGLQPELLNDDRVGRLLDAVAESASEIKAAFLLRVINVFGLDISKLHWDLTSLRFEGDYDRQDPDYPTATYGFDPKEPRKYKQFRLGNLVNEDGAIPLFHQAYSGNTADIDTVIDCLPQLVELRKMAGRTIRVVGDSKLLSRQGMVTLTRGGISFICPESHNCALDQQFLSLKSEDWVTLNYVSERQADLPEKLRTKFRAQEVPFAITVKVPDEAALSERKGKKATEDFTFRRIFVYSSEEEGAQRENRERLSQRLEAKLTEFSGKLSSHYWKKKSLAQAQRALDKLLDSSVGKLYTTQLAAPGPEETGWVLQWSLDRDKLAYAESLDGYYTLMSSVSIEDADLHQIFRDYKEQTQIERRFSEWKGPLKLRPVFLKSNKRIEGLVLLLSAALMIFSLIEQQVRKNLKATAIPELESLKEPETSSPNEQVAAQKSKAIKASEKIVGLYPEGRAARPTGRNILAAFDGFYWARFRIAGKIYEQFSPSSEIQKRLLTILNLTGTMQKMPNGP
jgi:transposase